VLADISSRGGKVPPLYLYPVYILPGLIYSVESTGKFLYVPFLLLSVAILPLMAATNLFDDYFDFKNGVDLKDSPNTIYRRHPIFHFNVTPRYLILWATILSVIYIIFIIILSLFYGIAVLIIGLTGWGLGYGYTGWPLSYKYRGLGELGVFLSSILANMIIIAATVRSFRFGEVLFILPFSILMTLVLFVGNYRDRNYDRASGLRTIVVRLGEGGSKIFLSCIFIVFYALDIFYSFIGIYPLISLVTLVTSPIAYNASNSWYQIDPKNFESYIGRNISIILGILLLLLTVNILIQKI
jgi:1,4-dihydroxy-2-naphthoate octaprenyltransferase